MSEQPIPIHWKLLGERRATALLMMGFVTALYTLMALLPLPDWRLCFAAMALVYGVAFFSVAAEWFWGRWFALGVGASGVSMALFGLATVGFEPALVVSGLVHALIYLPLLGPKMAERYEYQSAWREKWHVDEHGVARLRSAVRSAAAALPTLIFYTLAPRQGAAAVVLLVAAGVGAYGLLRLRAWGVVVLGGTAIATALHAVIGSVDVQLLPLGFAGNAAGVVAMPLIGVLAATFLMVSVAPFAAGVWRTLRAR